MEESQTPPSSHPDVLSHTLDKVDNRPQNKFKIEIKLGDDTVKVTIIDDGGVCYAVDDQDLVTVLCIEVP